MEKANLLHPLANFFIPSNIAKGNDTLRSTADLTFNNLTLRLSERRAMLASAFPSVSKVSEANISFAVTVRSTSGRFASRKTLSPSHQHRHHHRQQGRSPVLAQVFGVN